MSQGRMNMLVGIMGILALAVPAAPTAAATLELKSLDVYTSRDPQLAVQIELAVEKGYFREEGLDVTVKYLSGGGEIPPAMAGGSIKVAMAAHNNALNLIARDFPVKVIGTINDISGALGLAVRNALNVRSPKDLEGKKVGTFVYAATMDFLARMSARHGIDRNKIQVINLQPPDLAPTFARGDIDGALIWEPHLTRTAKQGGTVVLTGAQANFPEKKETYRLWGLPIVVFTPQEFIDKNPNTLVALLKGLARGNEFVHSNRAEAIKILTRKLSIPEDELTEMMGRNKYTMLIDQAFLNEMDGAADSQLAAKQIPKAPRAATYTVPDLMRKARPDWVTVR
ncbi:MAG: ABC transporter substrate-binding protein [Candidatus Rokubacteria bacterium]|nr:ABC transporter substrate-binding protein [Candidatus Rokubacteria bacterium]